jgi:hypothetical protein
MGSPVGKSAMNNAKLNAATSCQAEMHAHARALGERSDQEIRRKTLTCRTYILKVVRLWV